MADACLCPHNNVDISALGTTKNHLLSCLVIVNGIYVSFTNVFLAGKQWLFVHRHEGVSHTQRPQFSFKPHRVLIHSL